MARAQAARVHQLLDIVRQIEETQRVRDRGAGLRHLVRELCLRHSVLGEEPAVPSRLFNRVEVPALEVLDQRELEGACLVGGVHHDRDSFETGLPSGAPPTLSCNNLVTLPQRAHDDRLEQTYLADRVGELGDAVVVDVRPRLLGVRRDEVDREFMYVGRRLGLLRSARNERR